VKPIGLVRVDGAVVGVRRVETRATTDAEGQRTREGRVWQAVDIATDYAAYNGEVSDTVQAYVTVTGPANESFLAGLTSGEKVSLLAEPVLAWFQQGDRWRSYASLRFVGRAEDAAGHSLSSVSSASGF